MPAIPRLFRTLSGISSVPATHGILVQLTSGCNGAIRLGGSSSHDWLRRQKKDPFVKKAKYLNYRARSAFKLLEIDEKYHLFRPGQVVVDLGASPGSWTQVAVNAVNAASPQELAVPGEGPIMTEKTGVKGNMAETIFWDKEQAPFPGQSSNSPRGFVIGVDRLHVVPLPGAVFLSEKDFTDPKTQQTMRDLLQGREVDVVLSDMAPNVSGTKSFDHDMIMNLVKMACRFAHGVLAEHGTFLCKIFSGEDSKQFAEELARSFEFVKFVKPEASRDDSAELFLLAMKFRKAGVQNETRRSSRNMLLVLVPICESRLCFWLCSARAVKVHPGSLFLMRSNSYLSFRNQTVMLRTAACSLDR